MFQEEGMACAKTGRAEDGLLACLLFVEPRGDGLGKGSLGVKEEGQGQRGKQGQVTQGS